MNLDTIDHLIEKIESANPSRDGANLEDRIMKMLEETGELAEAFLDATSIKNKKGKTWDDVQEEAADVLIIAVDIALTGLHGKEELIQRIKSDLHRVNIGFYDNIVEISKHNTLFAAYHRHEASLAWECAVDMVRYAFAMNILVSRLLDGDKMSDHITKLVSRKLKKWQKQQNSQG